MAKKKDKAAKAGKLPKKVAGIKLPKEVRRQGEALIARAASPAGQAAIAKGLTLAAGLATMAAERSRAAAPVPPRPAESAEGAVPPPSSPSSPAPPLEPQKIAEAVSTVADAVLGRLFAGRKP